MGRHCGKGRAQEREASAPIASPESTLQVGRAVKPQSPS